MFKFYNFLINSGLTISLIIFTVGLLFRLVLYFLQLDWKLDRVAYKKCFPSAMKGGLYSIIMGVMPFSHVWRAQPLAAITFFALHVGAILVPIFLLAHNEILQMKFGFSFYSIPQNLSDLLTLITIASLVVIVARRIMLAHVRKLSSMEDFLILGIVALTFVTGFIARCMPEGNIAWTVAHLLSAEVLLIIAPFTKLSHIVLYFASRWQIGADFGIKRGGSHRKSLFPW